MWLAATFWSGEDFALSALRWVPGLILPGTIARRIQLHGLHTWKYHIDWQPEGFTTPGTMWLYTGGSGASIVFAED